MALMRVIAIDAANCSQNNYQIDWYETYHFVISDNGSGMLEEKGIN